MSFPDADPPPASDLSRRGFLLASSAAVVAPDLREAAAMTQDSPPDVPAPDAGPPPVTERTIAEAERLAAVTYTPAERRMIAGSIGAQIERTQARMAWSTFSNDQAPALVFDPRLPGFVDPDPRAGVVPTGADPGPVPDDDTDLAFAPVTRLSEWLRRRDLTSTRLTRIYLDRLERFGPRLECVVTPTADLALEQARRADDELAAGRWRGPLHGVPWGAKDLLDTKGIATTWGAMPFRGRVPSRDAIVVDRLAEAGAVLVAKLTLGALAYGDVWFGGRTRNPWNTEQGSSGSSAGSAAATVAGLAGFTIGTETYGSIVSPCVRCGATGLRPTFGRVARTGAMALCWSLDKIGPITRGVEDAMLVLDAINGADADDVSSLDVPLAWNAATGPAGMRVGVDPAWFDGPEATDVDRALLDTVRGLGVRIVEVRLPDWPYEALLDTLFAEAAAAFEAITLENTDDDLVWQDAAAWPNTFREARFISAVQLVQADRMRRQVMRTMDDVMSNVDVLLSPSFAGDLLLITNFTGHPCLTLRSGEQPDGTMRAATIWGRLFDEGALATLGTAIERAVGVRERRPDGFE